MTLGAQIAGTCLGVGIAFIGGSVIDGLIKVTVGVRLSEEEEFQGADLSIHRITATPEVQKNRLPFGRFPA